MQIDKAIADMHAVRFQLLLTFIRDYVSYDYVASTV